MKLDLLIKQGEHQQQDFKHNITSAEKIAKTIVAFANTNGGRLLIGVKDNGKLYGIQPDEERYMIEAAIESFCKPKINVDFEEIAEGDKLVLIAHIYTSQNGPCYAKDENGLWWAYVRVQDKTVLAGIVTLESLKRKHQNLIIEFSEVEKGLLAILEDGKSIDLKSFEKLFKLKRKSSIPILVNLINAKVIKINYDDNKETFVTCL